MPQVRAVESLFEHSAVHQAKCSHYVLLHKLSRSGGKCHEWHVSKLLLQYSKSLETMRAQVLAKLNSCSCFKYSGKGWQSSKGTKILNS